MDVRQPFVGESRRARNPTRLHWLFLAVLMASSAGFMGHRLGNPYITAWDESMHVNVVRNLIDDCCVPRLHRQPVGTNLHDWTDNHVWLHKPPLPFYVNAAIAWLGAGSIFAIRLAALFAAQCLVALVFFTGLRFFDTPTSVAAATLVAFNHYTFQLVQGRQFSGLPDLTLACAATGAVYFLLGIAEQPRRWRYVVFGVLSGLAFLCKDGLGLIPLGILGLAGFSGVVPWRRHLVGVLFALGAALALAAPAALYVAFRFPTEALLEQQLRVAHVWRDVEGWARPLDFYVSVYAGRVTSPLLVGTAVLAIIHGLRALRGDHQLGLLALWTAAYVAVLSLAVSKISNFIYPIVPALYLLLPATVMRLRRAGRHDVLIAGATAVCATAVFLQWDLADISSWVVDSPPRHLRPRLIAFQTAVFAVGLLSLRRSGLRCPGQASVAATVAALVLVLVASVNASRAAANARPRDHAEQAQLREAATRLRDTLRADDIVLVDWPGLRKGYLYVMFWSGLESFEVGPVNPLSDRLAKLPSGVRAYLLTSSAGLPYPIDPAWSGPGHLHRVDDSASRGTASGVRQ